MPTILDLCECPVPDDILGTSLVPLWTQREAEYDVEVVVSEMRRDPWHRIAVRTEDFKFIWDNKRPNQPVLYDLQADPAEKQNVASLHPQQVSRFQAIVNAQLQRAAETEPGTAAPKLELDEEVVMRLRDLGYME